MIQIPDFGDERVLYYCAFCGGETGTRDHCPSKVFLDKPYPTNLPTVPACPSCNNSFSPDEEYLACYLSCLSSGSTDPDEITRVKTRLILERQPALRERIESSRFVQHGRVAFQPEYERIVRVFTKLAQGHALFELHESYCRPPDAIDYFPLAELPDKQREIFETPPPFSMWPEVGSRAMQRIIGSQDRNDRGWIVVQPGRYRFIAGAGFDVYVRIVIDEYLGCTVKWRDLSED